MDSRKSWQKSEKTRHTLKKNHKKQGKNKASKYNAFLLTYIHDTLTAFFKMDELDD